MLKFLTALAMMSATPVALADPHIPQWKTPHAMGCMLVRDCKEGVEKITNIKDVTEEYTEKQEEEFDDLLAEMNRIGIGVFLADGKYFLRGQRGVYHTTGNNFFLNREYVGDVKTLLSVTRHEGWHAAQDCMAGSIDNNSIAIIHHPNMVPQGYKLRAEIAYASNPHVIPWEQEAIWASEEPYMTANALRACQNPEVAMWSVYPPTPLTGEWLINNGFWNGQPK